MLIPEEINFLVSSDPSAGAVNRSQDGSEFEIQFDDALIIPQDAVSISVCCEESTVWWVVPNIITNLNNTFYVYGDSTLGVPTLYTIQIAQGLYDLSALNTSLLNGLETAGARQFNGTVYQPLISLSPDNATQKVLIRFNYSNVYIDFSQPSTPREILGFNSAVYGPYALTPQNILAPNVAAFNTVNSFLISSDIIGSKGIRFNNRYNQIISQVLINVSPGSQIVSTPFNPPRLQAQELAGAKRTNLRFRLSDDKLRPVNTNGEFWTARIVIRYLRPFTLVKL
jgi:hypothetical protein